VGIPSEKRTFESSWRKEVPGPGKKERIFSPDGEDGLSDGELPSKKEPALSEGRRISSGRGLHFRKVTFRDVLSGGEGTLELDAYQSKEREKSSSSLLKWKEKETD